MKVKRHFTTTILLIISTILMTVDCVDKKGDSTSSKNRISSLLNTISGDSFKNWNTSSFARNFQKAVGFVPAVNENDVSKLLYLISNDADLIKIGAFNKLNKLSKRVKLLENKKLIILAQLQATIELIKYYGIKYNCPKVKFTFAQGLYYAHKCQKLLKENPGECLKKKTQLLESFAFSHKVEQNRIMKYWIKKTIKEAEIYLGEDKTLQFIDTRIACEIKLIQENKNIILKTTLKLYGGSAKKGLDCVAELKPFEHHIKEIGSFPGEFHYLLARAYSQQGNNEETIKHLLIARKADVVDSKTRYVNKKVQEYYEKIYTRMNAKNK
ncbi:uncharacterized protein LOC113548122 [Rhopalosiphum maidis]|uniref:uncharacterized protein LOC113548122 n=1 Tax=Rhopalosiphum maidis TaxID=43146 RepID=UPI000EFF27CC|nr:uncharacterized protein LOC113548122 [Rhopalosiphum maidis]